MKSVPDRGMSRPSNPTLHPLRACRRGSTPTSPSRYVGRAIVTLLLVVATPSLEASARQQLVDPLVTAYNGRSIGAPGIRELSLELLQGETVTRRFQILQAWVDGPGARSVVLLESPKGLRGTGYLLRETDTQQGAEVFLHLPAGEHQILKIHAGRYEEGLLGSDFAYSDLLWRIPTSGRAFRRLPQATPALGAGAVVVMQILDEGLLGATAWPEIRYHFRQSPPLPVLVEYIAHRGTSHSKKVLSLEDWRLRAGAWMPSRMVMTLPGGRSSVLTLRSALSGSDIPDWSALTPELLPRLASELRAGGRPAMFRGLDE